MADERAAASEKARFAARELIAKLENGAGLSLPPGVRDRMLSAAELGYLRGWGDGVEHGMNVASQLAKKAFDDALRPILPIPEPTLQQLRDRRLGEEIAATYGGYGNPSLAATFEAAAKFTHQRRRSPVRSDECPMEDPQFGGYCESDAQFRERITRESGGDR